jgi:signal transduction histidine kinase
MTERANILLVDDKAVRLLTYEAILGRLGHNLVRAQSGTEALGKLMDMEFAAILLDVSMPEMDGFETAALIRDHPRSAQTPIIFVTGVHLTDLDRLKGYEMGAADYVSVPIVPEILRGKVHVLVQLYLQRRELSRLNQQLVTANAELAEAHSQLQAENTRELQKLNRTLELANTQLTAEVAERKRAEMLLTDEARRKDEFLAILAHELRNPLSAIHGGVQLMRTPSMTQPKLTWVRDLLERQLEHLTRLIDDLLDISRITSGRVQLQRETLELGNVITQSIDAVRSVIDAHGHELDVRLPDQPLYLDADLVRLIQVFGNLLTNAAKYTEDGGSINLTVETHGGPPGCAVVRIRDSGAGISADMLERVFELFTQASSEGRTQSGLGIGLSLVRALVELHGGTVQATSGGLGQGSEFAVRLPLLESVPARAVPDTSRRPCELPRLRLLIIDDNVDSACGLAMYLEEMAGHEVRLAHTGNEGITTALEFGPQIVLLDIGLPDIDGYEVARRLRGDSRFNGVPLIAMTGFGGAADRDRAERAGFTRYLVKPVAYDTLTDVLLEQLAVEMS